MDESTFNKLLVDNLQLRIQVADLQKRLAEQQLTMLLQTLGSQQAQQPPAQEPPTSTEEKVEDQAEPSSPVVEPPVVSAPVVPVCPARTKVLSQADLRVTKSAKP